MHWFYLLLSFGALLLAITTVHGWLLLLSLLAALGFFLAWIRGWYLERIGGRQQNELAMIDPAELRRLGLEEHLSAQRSNGLRAMVERIRLLAANA